MGRGIKGHLPPYFTCPILTLSGKVVVWKKKYRSVVEMMRVGERNYDQITEGGRKEGGKGREGRRREGEGK